jgi:hypothetical protein
MPSIGRPEILVILIAAGIPTLAVVLVVRALRPSGKPAKASWRTVVVASLLAVVALAAVGFLSAPLIERAAWELAGNAPPIDRLVSTYETHRSQFAALARMTPEGPQFSLVMTRRGAYLESEWVRALTQGRIKQYEANLRPIGGLYLGWSRGDIDVTLGRTGIVIGGDTWGYIRSRQPPAAVVTLKQAHAFFHDPWCYPLGDGWYAYNFNN